MNQGVESRVERVAESLTDLVLICTSNYGTEDELVEALVQKIRDINDALNIPQGIKNSFSSMMEVSDLVPPSP